MDQTLDHAAGLVPLEPVQRVPYVAGPHGDEREIPLLDLIERQVAARGGDDAIVSSEGTWTLAEAWQRVKMLAADLHEAMAGRRLPVVVMARKGLTQGAALLACVRLGVPYMAHIQPPARWGE